MVDIKQIKKRLFPKMDNDTSMYNHYHHYSGYFFCEFPLNPALKTECHVQDDDVEILLNFSPYVLFI